MGSLWEAIWQTDPRQWMCLTLQTSEPNEGCQHGETIFIGSWLDIRSFFPFFFHFAIFCFFGQFCKWRLHPETGIIVFVRRFVHRCKSLTKKFWVFYVIWFSLNSFAIWWQDCNSSSDDSDTTTFVNLQFLVCSTYSMVSVLLWPDTFKWEMILLR